MTKIQQRVIKVYTILDKSETDKYDYNIYGYNGIVNIKIDGNEYSFERERY